jgi:ParB family chromosome partitioning protein
LHGVFEVQEIPLAAVDFKDHTLATPPGPEGEVLDRLTASLKEVGLLSPPWLRPRADGAWQVVTGWKRLLAAVRLNWPQVTACTLPGAAPDSHCLLVGLYDNSFTRGFDLREQAHLAARLLVHWDRATVTTKFLPYLGLPPSSGVLSRLLALAGLEPCFLELAARGRLALTAAAALAAWAPEDRFAALPFLEKLWLSQSKQEQIVEEVTLLARREGVTPKAVLSRPGLRGPLQDEGLSPQERTEAVRRELKLRVQPGLSATWQVFQAALKRLGLEQHPRMRLKPPPAFEGPDFHLEIDFRDVSELAELLEEIARLVRRDEFSALTRL